MADGWTSHGARGGKTRGLRPGVHSSPRTSCRRIRCNTVILNVGAIATPSRFLIQAMMPGPFPFGLGFHHWAGWNSMGLAVAISFEIGEALR